MTEIDLKKLIREQTDISGKIQEIDIFETWFNPHCAIVINRVLWYALRLVVYEPDRLFIRKISEHWNLKETKMEITQY